MNVEVTLVDGTKIYPSYSPEHRKSVIEFYSTQFDKGLIMGWAIV
jgi:hypothetical protein